MKGVMGRHSQDKAYSHKWVADARMRHLGAWGGVGMYDREGTNRQRPRGCRGAGLDKDVF